jgi:predicted extracellular nuclease|tara:strand:+ start:31887 stop:32837 length:951 start_codon:yes stop_codon:yes gene_type:complete
MKYSILLLSFLLFGVAFTQKQATVLFYNVENLFDTKDDKDVLDEEYLPQAAKVWNIDRYNTKVSRIAKVMNEFDNIAFMGMCEIENKGVVKDVVKAQDKKLKIVHFDSQDARGIDVALLYDKKTFCLKKKGFLGFTLTVNDETKATRDILWAKFKQGKSYVYVMVNHWPSRSGGELESEPNRLLAATTAKSFIDEILAEDPNAKIIFMGDLNDYPTNNSVKLIDEKLDPMISKSSGSLGGSYSYRGEYDVLDHIMISPGMNTTSGLRAVANSGKINEFSYLLTTYKENIVPFRTYARDEYLDGYSDHLPVSFTIEY